MFPPNKTGDPYEWVGGLWTSLRHAAPHVGERVDITPVNEKSAEVSIRLIERPSSKVEKTLREYIRTYAKTCGWKTAEVKIKNGYVVFRANIEEPPAASRA